MSKVKQYIDTMKQRPPHERRQAAMRISAAITGVIFVGWLATLGLRLAAPSPATASNTQNSFSTQVASVFSAFSLPGASKSNTNTLEVASSSNY